MSDGLYESSAGILISDVVLMLTPPREVSTVSFGSSNFVPAFEGTKGRTSG